MQPKRVTKIYSYSRISSFDQCKLKFKYKYIDCIPELKKSIESCLGKAVHEALEWLYTQVQNKKLPELEEVIIKYTETWNKNHTPDTLIVKQDFTTKDYFNKGVKFLIDYYMKHHPFNDNTLEIEKRIEIDLDEEGKYKILGFIDRLVHNEKTGEYEIHDYKTANSLPMQEKIENDKQLALYAIAIKQITGNTNKICLTWHYLAHNKKICSWRTDEQLEELRQETIKKIQEIEIHKDFHPNKSALCNWCAYQNICPAFGYTPPQREKQETLPTESEKEEALDIW